MSCEAGTGLANDLAKFSERPVLSQDWATLRRFVNHTMKQDYVRYVSIVDPTGKVMMHSDLSQVGKIDKKTFRGRYATPPYRLTPMPTS